MPLSGATLIALLVACGGGGDGAARFRLVGGGGGSAAGGGLPASGERARAQDHSRRALWRGEFPRRRRHRAGSHDTTLDRDVLLKHFSSITAENAMKPDTVWPNSAGTGGALRNPPTQPNFVPADTLADFAFNNGIQLRGHTLLWHQSAPDWFFAGDPTAIPSTTASMCSSGCATTSIAVVQHFPNVYAWDVVNEVASDTPEPRTRIAPTAPGTSPTAWAAATAREYVRDAFLFASQARNLARPQQLQHEADAE